MRGSKETTLIETAPLPRDDQPPEPRLFDLWDLYEIQPVDLQIDHTLVLREYMDALDVVLKLCDLELRRRARTLTSDSYEPEAKHLLEEFEEFARGVSDEELRSFRQETHERHFVIAEHRWVISALLRKRFSDARWREGL